MMLNSFQMDDFTATGEVLNGPLDKLFMFVEKYCDYVFLQERRSILNPNGEREIGIPQNNLQESPIPRNIQFGAKRK